MTRTRIIALLAWYMEDAGWLRDTIRGLTNVPVDHLIAIDGAYALYPDGHARSTPLEYEAIITSAHDAGIGLTLHTPREPWAGNECEKRSKLFELADQEATPGQDWYLVIDADEIITTVPADLRDQLTATERDVAQVTFVEPHPDATTHTRPYPMPILFRAIPGIQVTGNHFTYQTPDGRYLWGNATTDDLEPRLDLADVFELQHLTHYRDPARSLAAAAYYDERDEQTAETFQCGHTGCELTAKHPLPVHWHPNDGGFVAEWVWTCRDHARIVANKGRWELSQHIGWERAAGYYHRKLWLTSSDELKVEHRAGPVPVA